MIPATTGLERNQLNHATRSLIPNTVVLPDESLATLSALETRPLYTRRKSTKFDSLLYAFVMVVVLVSHLFVAALGSLRVLRVDKICNRSHFLTSLAMPCFSHPVSDMKLVVFSPHTEQQPLLLRRKQLSACRLE